MVNIAELLKKSIEKQKMKPTSEVRQHIYEKARSAIKSKLSEMDAPELVRRSYMLQLEAAICEVEAFYVLEPEFFELREDNATCHFAYNAYLPDYFGTRRDVVVDPLKLRPLSGEPAQLIKIEKIDEDKQALQPDREHEVFTLHSGQEESSQVLPDEAYPVDLNIADQSRNDNQNSELTDINGERSDKFEPSGSDLDDGHIEPLIEGLEEEFNELSKNIADETLEKEREDQNGKGKEQIFQPRPVVEDKKSVNDDSLFVKSDAQAEHMIEAEPRSVNLREKADDSSQSQPRDNLDLNERTASETRSENRRAEEVAQEPIGRVDPIVAKSAFSNTLKNETRVENDYAKKPQPAFTEMPENRLETTSVNAGQSETSSLKQDSVAATSINARHIKDIGEVGVGGKDIDGKDIDRKNIDTKSGTPKEATGVFGFSKSRRGFPRRSAVDDYPLYIDTPSYPASAGGFFGKDAFGTIGGQTASMERQPFGTFDRETATNKADSGSNHQIAGFKTETVVMASTTPISKDADKAEIFSRKANGQAGTNELQTPEIATKANPANMSAYNADKGVVNSVMSAETTADKVSAPISQGIGHNNPPHKPDVEELNRKQDKTADSFLKVGQNPAQNDRTGSPIKNRSDDDNRLGGLSNRFSNDANGKSIEQNNADTKPQAQLNRSSEKTFLVESAAPVKNNSGEEWAKPDDGSSFPEGQASTYGKTEVISEKRTIISNNDGTTSIDEESKVLAFSGHEIPEKNRKVEEEFPAGVSDEKEEKESTLDIAEKFEQKRTEFFDRLDNARNDRLEQDLFPTVSSFDQKDRGKTVNRSLSRGQRSSNFAKILTGRLVAAGAFFVFVLAFGAYFLSRSGPSIPLTEQHPQNIATRDQDVRNNPDPAQTAAINDKGSNDNAEKLLRENYIASKNQKNDQNNFGKKIIEEKADEPLKSGEKDEAKPTESDDIKSSNDASSVIDKKQPEKLASIPISVTRPVVEEMPNKNSDDEPTDNIKNDTEKLSQDKQGAGIEKPEASLLLINDKKGKQVKLQSTVTWSLKPPHSPENPLDETALVANFKTDDGKLGARMSIRKNYRDNLGATHLIDLSFSQADGFDSGVVVDVKGVYYGDKINVLNKQASTIVADLYENNFVASLRDDKDNKENNRNFLTRSAVIGFQTVFTDGKTALFMLNKGAAENQLFDRFNDPTTH